MRLRLQVQYLYDDSLEAMVSSRAFWGEENNDNIFFTLFACYVGVKPPLTW